MNIEAYIFGCVGIPYGFEFDQLLLHFREVLGLVKDFGRKHKSRGLFS